MLEKYKYMIENNMILFIAGIIIHFIWGEQPTLYPILVGNTLMLVILFIIEKRQIKNEKIKFN